MEPFLVWLVIHSAKSLKSVSTSYTLPLARLLHLTGAVCRYMKKAALYARKTKTGTGTVSARKQGQA